MFFSGGVLTALARCARLSLLEVRRDDEGKVDPASTLPSQVGWLNMRWLQRRDMTARILIVEDEPLLALELEAVLSDAGFAVAGVAGSF